MPTLNWIGKDKVVNHYKDIPFRILDPEYTYKDGETIPGEASENRIIHGDNLEALKALLPEYEGNIRLIYGDLPYNTGNEGWEYNDNVNDPRIRRWLGKVVGKEGEDLSRHDKWLCMVYPRLKLLHRLLSEDGVIFMSIDDNEQAHLKLLMDEIFGHRNFMANIIWEKKFAPSNDAKHIDANHEYLLLYARNIDKVRLNLLPRTTEMDARYKNPDGDPRGVWTSGDSLRKEYREYAYFPVTTPSGRTVYPPTGASWRFNKEDLPRLMEENRLWFGKDGSGVPRIKRFLSDVKGGIIPQTIWKHEDVGNTQESKKELIRIFSQAVFETPKPTRLLQRVIEIATDKDSTVLDAFAGSGTTAHAVLNMNKDGGTRKFVLVEMEDYADALTAERVKRVITGYGNEKKPVAGTGGDFTFYRLGEPLFTEDGILNEVVPQEKIREYIYYTETGQRLGQQTETKNTHYLDTCNGISYYFVYSKVSATALDIEFLNTIETKAEQYVIYADNCLLSPEFMQKNNLIFKKIPRDITRF